MKQRHYRKLIAISAAFIVGFSLWAAAPSKSAESTPNQTIPMDIELEFTDGSPSTTLAEVAKGQKAILIDFWASFCGPCKKYLPKLQAKTEELGTKGVKVVGMNLDRKKEKAERIIKQKGTSFCSLCDSTAQNYYSSLLNIQRIPTVVLISASGEVLYQGTASDESEKEIDAIISKLNESQPETTPQVAANMEGEQTNTTAKS